MTDERRSDENARATGSPVTVFVSDPSAEAERIAQALRGEGYGVVDVPLSMLVARVAVQRPRVVLVDADAEGAIEVIGRVREIDGADTMDVVFLGKAGESLVPDEVVEEGSGYFERPVDVRMLLRKVETLTGGPRRGEAEIESSSIPAVRAAVPSLPPASMRSPDTRALPTPIPRPPVPSLAGQLEPALRKSERTQAPLSGELESLLFEAEQRLGGQVGQMESMIPSPEEEIEAVLPAEVLASLDEPLDDDEDDPVVDGASSALHRGGTTGAGRITTGGSTGAGSTGASRVGEPSPPLVPRPPPLPEATQPTVKTHAGTHAGSTGAGTTGGSLTGLSSAVTGRAPVEGVPAPSIVEVSLPPAPERPAVPTPRTGPPVPMPAPAPATAASVLGTADAPRALAQAIASRASGVLAFGAEGGVRRVALREGDVTTAASTVEDESLLPFLAARGELPRDRVALLAGKVPPFGRHAGAALVAHGYLRQDQLWQVLRAHAEWILGRVVAMTSGTAGFEDDPPVRVKSEPGVFGASTGAEVLVEVMRRVVAPQEAIARLGGEGARVADGARASLLSECALGEVERTWLARARGGTVGEALRSASDPDFASVLYALVSLGVCEAIRPLSPARAPSEKPAASASVDPLDEEAIRARVRARLQLVDEGDYFSVLGVSRDATGYEVKRAFLELRRAFEPARLLTPALADLRGDVEKITMVLDEAYEILRDGARRERYRRAIDASPG